MIFFATLFQDARRDKRGFTVMLAALIASIVLALGASIYSIAQKQVTLSSLGRDSQFAFYAADTAAECALYWDLRFARFADLETTTFVQEPISCDGQTPSDIEHNLINGSVVTTFTIEDLFEGETSTSGNCAEVTISKNPTNPFTVIRADGYSLPCALIEESGRTLQRSVELRY